MSSRPNRKRKARQTTIKSFCKSESDIQLGLALSMSMYESTEREKCSSPSANNQELKITEFHGKSVSRKNGGNLNPPPSVKENVVNINDIRPPQTEGKYIYQKILLYFPILAALKI